MYKQLAQYLVDMINSLNVEGTKLMSDLTLDALKELGKRLMK